MKELPVIACTLPGADLPARAARWRALADRALLERSRLDRGVRLVFRSGPGVAEELHELAALERDCCSFASFRLESSAERVTLDVTAAGDGVVAVREIFG